MSRLHRLVYLSRPELRLADADLDQILSSARRHNGVAGLTGFLAFHAHVFLQVLEGPSLAVSACLRRLMLDPRHHGLELLSAGEIDSRLFADWGMGYAALSSRHERLLMRHCGAAVPDAHSMSAEGALHLLMALARDSQSTVLAAPPAPGSARAVGDGQLGEFGQ